MFLKKLSEKYVATGETFTNKESVFEVIGAVHAIKAAHSQTDYSTGMQSMRTFLSMVLAKYSVSSSSIVLRPKDWNATSDEAVAWLSKIKKSGHLYRGMTSQEYAATIGAHKPIKSTGLHSFKSEGTCFSDDPADAESYVNYGKDDPRKTNLPTYLIEIKKPDNIARDRDGYYKTTDSIDLNRVTNIWIMQAKDGAILLKSNSN